MKEFKDVPSFIKEQKPDKKDEALPAQKDKARIINYYAGTSLKENKKNKKSVITNKLQSPIRRKLFKAFAYGAVAATGITAFLNDDEVKENKVNKTDKEKTKEEQEEEQREVIEEHVVDRFERSIEKWKTGARAEEIKKIIPQENMTPKEIVDEFLRLFKDKKERTELLRFFPEEVFEANYFIAGQHQESRGDKDAVSPTGAKGVYQNFPDSIIDCVRYLNDMREEGLIPYRGPSKIDEATAKKIIEYFDDLGDYGRTGGKIYQQAIFNPVSSYNKKKNVFRGKSRKEMQGRLLAAYHDGPNSRKKNDAQLIEAARVRAKKAGRKYSKRDSAVYYRETIFGYMEDLQMTRNVFNKLGLKLKYEDTAVDKMLHIYERYSKRSSKEDLIVKFKDLLKMEKDKRGRDLSRGEIADVFAPYLSKK